MSKFNDFIRKISIDEIPLGFRSWGMSNSRVTSLALRPTGEFVVGLFVAVTVWHLVLAIIICHGAGAP